MKIIAKLTTSLACLVTALAFAAAAVAAPPDPMMASRVIQLVNSARQQSGLQPLVMNQKLMQAAQTLADDLASRHVLSHTDASGQGLDARFLAVDYVHSQADEVVGGSQPSPDIAVAEFLSQPGNRGSLLNPNVRDAGVGVALRPQDIATTGITAYWVIDLGLQVERGPGP